MIERDQLVIQARVTLRDIEPPIWRLLLLPQDLNLAQFHEVLQAAFGWTDSHLHQFIIGGLSFGAPEFNEGYEDQRTTFEATDVRLRDFDFVHAHIRSRWPRVKIILRTDSGFGVGGWFSGEHPGGDEEATLA